MVDIILIFNMVNTREKGRRIELEAKKLLIKDGYLVEKKNASRWQSDDFWELFDLFAMKSNDFKLIQIKSNISDFYKARKEINEWLIEHNISGMSFEIWLKEPRKKWRKEILSKK
jgi:Holliday junction resolvase